MPDREKPKTQKGQLEELWDKLIGTNGNGLITHFKKHCEASEEDRREMHESLDGLTADMEYVKGRLDGQTETAKPSRDEINKQRTKEVLVISAVIGGSLICIALLALLALGVLAPTDVIEAIKAWRGT